MFGTIGVAWFGLLVASGKGRKKTKDEQRFYNIRVMFHGIPVGELSSLEG